MLVSFKNGNRIHHMLQDFRASNGPFFGDVADQKDGYTAGFGVAHKQRRAFFNLAYRTRSAVEPAGV